MYDTEEEIERLVRDFESCAIAAADFHHREHLVVAVWYLQTLSRDEAVTKMRAALLRFIDHHGVDPKKYSEEVTVFWVDAIANQLEGIGSETRLVQKCKQVIDALQSTGGLNSPARRPAIPVVAEE
jgi:hypothetical protein